MVEVFEDPQAEGSHNHAPIFVTEPESIKVFIKPG
jgi:hypothetical protein